MVSVAGPACHRLQRQETDPVKRLQFVRQAEKIIEEDLPWVILGFVETDASWWDYMHNVYSPDRNFNWYNDNRMEEVWKEKR